MYYKKTRILLEGKEIENELQFFDNSDLPKLEKIYWSWVNLSNDLEKFGGRRINIPEILSEAIYCINFNAGRLTSNLGSGIKSSFDCWDKERNTRIQVKASSVKNDLTSFGPRSVWDELYFVHFFPNDTYDGSYSIYKIPNDLIYNHKVSKLQSFTDQQKQNRRPRFSLIREIIKPNKLTPLFESTF